MFKMFFPLKLFQGRGKEEFSPIGINLARDRAYVFQAKRVGEGMEIVSAATGTYDDSRERVLSDSRLFNDYLSQFFEPGYFYGQQVVTSLPSEVVSLRTVHYPSAGGKPDRGAIIGQVAESLPGAIDDWVIDYMPIRRPDGEAHQAALVAIAKRQDVLSYLEHFTHMGLEVKALQISPIAIRRLATFVNRQDDYANTAILNFGQSNAYLTILWGRRLVSDTELSIGKQQFIRVVAEGLQQSEEVAAKILAKYGLMAADTVILDDDVPLTLAKPVASLVQPLLEQLIDEVQVVQAQTVSFMEGEDIKRAFILGGLVGWPGLEERLCRDLGMAVHTLDPFAPFIGREEFLALNDLDLYGGMSIAAGHALYGMNPEGGV